MSRVVITLTQTDSQHVSVELSFEPPVRSGDDNPTTHRLADVALRAIVDASEGLTAHGFHIN